MSSTTQSDTINFALLIVELVLLVVTILLLALNRREQKSRDRLIQHISNAADVVTRQEYFVTVLDTIQGSRKYLYGIVTGSPPSAEENEVIRQLTDTIAQATSRGVNVRYLLPHAPDRLQMAQRYTKSGAEIRFSSAVLVSDARYMVVDDRTVVVGVPDRKGRDEPTRKGHVIPSESVAALFREQFEKLWGSSDARGYHDYLREVVTKARESNPSISAELIASNLRVAKEDIEAVLSKAD